MEDLTNIWNIDDELNEDQLMNYITGKSSEEEMHAIENQMNESDFVNDAVEGLQSFQSKQKLNDYVKQLNKELHAQTDKKKQQKEKRKIKDLSWILIAVALILFLCLAGYAVLKLRGFR
jgi:hypothetical protein